MLLREMASTTEKGRSPVVPAKFFTVLETLQKEASIKDINIYGECNYFVPKKKYGLEF